MRGGSAAGVRACSRARLGQPTPRMGRQCGEKTEEKSTATNAHRDVTLDTQNSENCSSSGCKDRLIGFLCRTSAPDSPDAKGSLSLARGARGSCSETIGDLRNRQLEAVLAAMTTTCQFKRYGCCETVRFTEKRSHEDACLHAPFDCPFAGCRYRGLQLYDHVQDAHAADAVYVISYVRGTAVTLRKVTPFLVLVQPACSCCSTAATCWPGARSRCSASDRGLRGTWSWSTRWRSVVEMSPARSRCRRRAPCRAPAGSTGSRRRGSLFVPDAYWGDSGTVSVKVRV
ncbi:hypothetical protein PR202_ga23642 [Eleusine coracana subsp. coracana]|uniref:SIAH-type domain-containing protein n=1 Tax=Eleusine coracana subsp. coracana TaxID=191504 RepID=A0AAV5D728_ELECO|nr:hypothetical protein PR202_ga23642 [Eleusine coracana subsp. coracana]